MYKHNIIFIGLDTHKVSTEVTHIEGQYGAKPVHYGKDKYHQSRHNKTCSTISIQLSTRDTALCL
jgi:hypothetical protein